MIQKFRNIKAQDLGFFSIKTRGTKSIKSEASAELRLQDRQHVRGAG